MTKFCIPLFLASILLMSCNSNVTTKTEVITLTETSESWNGEQLPKYLEGKPKVTILKVIIPPKSTLKMHKHLVINAGVLIKGELTVISEHNDTLYLKTGEPIVEVVNTWHYGINEGDESAEIIVFYAGIEETPITVLKEEK